MNLYWALAFNIGILAATSTPAHACRCGAISTFEEEVKTAPLVVAGRVASVGERASNSIGRGPRTIELEIVRVTKGSLEAPRITVWDPGAGSNCGGAFEDMPTGTLVMVTLHRVNEARSKAGQFWQFIRFNPPDDDFVIPSGPCAQPIRVLRKPS